LVSTYIISREPVRGVLSLASIAIKHKYVIPKHPYNHSPHRYGPDTLRIVLPTSHHEGTNYILPCRGSDSQERNVGFDAVWSPKVANEHRAADGEIMRLFSNMRADRWARSEPLERLRATMASWYARVADNVTVDDVEYLADWIYVSSRPEWTVKRKIECLRKPKTHLIGRDLMFALCHAEYLVFMFKDKLKPETQAKLGMLRFMRRSGASPPSSQGQETIGFSPSKRGVRGYRQAVKHVYRIFGYHAPDPDAIKFYTDTTEPPGYSYALDMRFGPDSEHGLGIINYVNRLWNLAVKETESTFSALWFFTTVWFMEMGNANGFHILPLECRDKQPDVVERHMAFRQAWWAACVAQLVAVSPTMFGLFAAGFVS